MPERSLRALFGSPAAGAVASQAVRAGSSLVLQAIVAGWLGPATYGRFAMYFGGLVAASAAATGLVGDSLTVLDRQSPAIRTALTHIATWLALGAASLAGVFAFAIDGLSAALIYATATVSFISAELLRRRQMAQLKFWRNVRTEAVIATISLIAALILLSAGYGLFGALAAIALSGLAPLLILTQAVLRTRAWAATEPARYREVFTFGIWRALQQFLRPSMLNLARWLVLLAAGPAAVGRLELARVVTAPAMLVVQGLGSLLFADYANARRAGEAGMLRRADQTAQTMLAGSLLVGGCLAVLWFYFSPFDATGYPADALALAGWTVYVASCAAILPYGSLAAVLGDARRVFLIRVADTVVSLSLAFAVTTLTTLTTSAVPFFLSVGSFVGGWWCRRLARSLT